MAEDTDKRLRNAVMYCVYVRQYSSDGTFEKVREDLRRIKELGTDYIWLMPIHPVGEKNRKGMLGSPYAVRGLPFGKPGVRHCGGLCSPYRRYSRRRYEVRNRCGIQSRIAGFVYRGKSSRMAVPPFGRQLRQPHRGLDGCVRSGPLTRNCGIIRSTR